jgi:hypothetical protein
METYIGKLFTLVLVTSIKKFSCKYFSIERSSVCCYLKSKADVANNPHLMPLWSGPVPNFTSSMSTSGFHPLLISVENMNLLPSSIYMHLKTNSMKHTQSLILGECGSQLISVFSDIS